MHTIFVSTKRKKKMETIATKGDYKVEFNGSSTYFVTDNNGTVLYRESSERKIMNRFKKVLECQNLI